MTLVTCDPCVNIVNTFLISLFCSHSWLLVLNIVEINLLIINVRYIVELSFILKGKNLPRHLETVFYFNSLNESKTRNLNFGVHVTTK